MAAGTSHLAGWRRPPARNNDHLWANLETDLQSPCSAARRSTDNAAKAPAPATCLPDKRGYLKATLPGAMHAELVWGNADTDCTGAVRPTDGGIRMRFSHKDGAEGNRLVLVFGAAGLREGQTARALPVNVTVIREGLGEFYGTQGDNKCTLDEVRQEPLVGIPRRSRSYRVIARGFVHIPRVPYAAKVPSCCHGSTMWAGSTSTAKTKMKRSKGGPMTAQRRMGQQ